MRFCFFSSNAQLLRVLSFALFFFLLRRGGVLLHPPPAGCCCSRGRLDSSATFPSSGRGAHLPRARVQAYCAVARRSQRSPPGPLGLESGYGELLERPQSSFWWPVSLCGGVSSSSSLACPRFLLAVPSWPALLCRGVAVTTTAAFFPTPCQCVLGYWEGGQKAGGTCAAL